MPSLLGLSLFWRWYFVAILQRVSGLWQIVCLIVVTIKTYPISPQIFCHTASTSLAYWWRHYFTSSFMADRRWFFVFFHLRKTRNHPSASCSSTLCNLVAVVTDGVTIVTVGTNTSSALNLWNRVLNM